MKLAVIVLALLAIAATTTASALEYEQKPKIAAYIYGSNYFDRGDEKNVVLIVFNSAWNEKIEYDDLNEAAFFSGRESMLFTAYDIRLTLKGNENVLVKSPEQRIPALQPFSPVNVNFPVKISDNATAGEYELALEVDYYIIDELRSLSSFPPVEVPNLNTTTISGSNVTVQRQNVTKIFTQNYELDYVRRTDTIMLKIYVKEKPVRIEVLKVEAENLVGKGKGKITLTVRNAGEKTARSAYLILDTPSGLQAQGLSLSQPAAAVPSGMGISGFPMMPVPLTQTASTTQSLSSAKASYYIGDLHPYEVAKATFYIKIDVKDGGTYPLQIKAVYIDEFGQMKESDSTAFGVEVRDAPKITVKDVESKVYVNAKGELTVTLSSSSELKDVSVRISVSSPLSALSSEYYVGDVRGNEDFKAVFKLKASSEATPISYPAEIKVVYRSMDEYFELDPVKIGVKVNPKMQFEVIGQPSISAGEERILTFTIKNVGEFEVRDATARITIVEPFSSTDDSAFIGNLKPGETANASFRISVDRDATPKLYALNLEVKYKDVEGEWAYSEPAKAVVNVTPPRPPYGIYALVAILIIAAVVYYLRKRR